MTHPRAPRGAGRGGGILFVLVILFLAYLVSTTLRGIVGLLLTAVLVAGAVALLANVARRR